MASINAQPGRGRPLAMKWLLQLVALGLFGLGVLASRAWLVDLSEADWRALVAGGLACWVASALVP